VTGAPDWKGLLWETRGYLGLDEDDPVPRDELVEQAQANGWGEREIQDAIRSTDALELVGDLDDPRVQLADRDEQSDIVDVDDDQEADETPDTESPTDDRTPANGSYADAEFDAPESDVYPPELLEREQWMGHVEKKPFAPWADRDAPAPCTKDEHAAATTDECNCDARWKWGYTENYADGETIAMAEVDPRLDGRAFLQQPDDPFAYVDGDDVRDPETGEVHPAFIAILEHLGLTYADVSQSGAGAHAIFRGELPDGVKEASWRLDDEPWGSNDELPSIEMYPGKRVCVMTGEHVPGTPTEIREWNADVLDALLEANDDVATAQREDLSTDRDDYDLSDYEPAATSTDETTSDIRDVFAALDRLDARDVAKRTIVHTWNDDASTSDGKRAFYPTWGKNSNGTANVVDDQIWQDTGDRGGYGGPVVMALIDAGELRPEQAAGGVRGEQWFQGVEHLQDLGFAIPEYEPDSGGETEGSAQPTSALPLGQLEALDHHERKRAAKKRGLDWPSTREARDELFATITEVMRNQDTAVVDAPTSLGKSHTVATTPWNNDATLDGVTGNAPVVHLHATRDARDEAIEAIEAAREADVDYFALQSRHEACDVAAGGYDPPAADADEELEYTPITMNGTAASEWLADMCEGRGIPFSAAHQRLKEHNDQDVDLPCCSGETTYDEEECDFEETPSTCPAISQWESYRAVRDDVDVVFATHNFAHVPGLRLGTNLVIDEEPDFKEDISKGRVEKAVTAYLQAIDAPVTTWEAFIQLSLNDQYGTDAAAEREQLRDALHQEPPLEHYFEDERAHTLAPALARAIFNADERANGRRFGKTPHEPPRLDAQAVDDDAWNREWVSVTLDEDNDIRTVRSAPDFSQTRSVVGLDAWPARPKWMVNVHPSIQIKDVLDSEERQLWRRFERGLRVVQVGDATRPLASGEYFNEGQVRALLEHLVDEYGAERVRTAITTSAVEGQLQQLMDEAGCVDPSTMHYGEEKSRNDFAHERVGLVNGCIDPGDDYVVDLLAELDLEAAPETVVDDDGDEHRARGRGFEGPDSDIAQEILASVRENHTAQAAGRYARDPGEDDSHATVFVRTDAMPAGLADVEVPGVEWIFTETQRAIVDELRSDAGAQTAREIAESVECSKEHVRTTLSRLTDDDVGKPAVQAFEKAGDHGATVYADSGAPNAGVVDTTSQLTAKDHVLDSYTWSLAIRDPTVSSEHEETATTESGGGEWDWRSAVSVGDPPSD
jgi:hypothetical protein